MTKTKDCYYIVIVVVGGRSIPQIVHEHDLPQDEDYNCEVLSGPYNRAQADQALKNS